MRRRNIAVTILAISLLTSCKPQELRSDIKAFIASFSLEDSINIYKKAGYSETTKYDDNLTHTKTVTTLSFDAEDPLNPSYELRVESYENEELKSSTYTYLTKEEEKFYLVSGDTKVLKTDKEVSTLLTNFFYTEVLLDGRYHAGGKYYGDYIREMAYDHQKLVKIDQENKLYVYSFDGNVRTDDGEFHLKQSYQVNEYGMLVCNSSTLSAGGKTSSTEIEVFRS